MLGESFQSEEISDLVSTQTDLNRHKEDRIKGNWCKNHAYIQTSIREDINKQIRSFKQLYEKEGNNIIREC